MNDEQQMHGIIAYDLGFRSRDAEVQALKALLVEVTQELSEEVTTRFRANYGDPIHPAMEGRYARDMDTVHRVWDYLRLNYKVVAVDAD